MIVQSRPAARALFAAVVACAGQLRVTRRVVDELSQVAGAVNSRRFPTNFDLNLHLERRFTFRGYRLGLRAGFNNITNHRNPTAVNNVIGSPQYLQFLGDEGRHFVLRLRVFGRKAD
jgi:hypothetical protein